MMGEAARKFVVDRYDLKRTCLPGQIELLTTIAGGRIPPTKAQ